MNKLIEKYERYLTIEGKDELTIYDHVFSAMKVLDIIGERASDWTHMDIMELKQGLKKYKDKNGCEKDYMTTTFNKHLMGAKIFFAFLFDMEKSLNIKLEDLDREFVFNAEKKEIGQKPFDYNLFEGFVKYLLNTGKGKNTVRARVTVLLAMTCGLRKCELRGLKRANIDFENNMINLEKTKYGKHRVLPIQGFVLDEIQKLYNLFPNSEYVICTNEGKPVVESQIHRSVVSTTKKAVVKGIIDVACTSHGLRKSFSGYLHFIKGVPGKHVQVLLGHSNLSTTEKSYLKVNDRDVQNKILSINMLGEEEEVLDEEVNLDESIFKEEL